jgi:HTH-type transcriptional regulator/antitoxin HigA
LVRRFRLRPIRSERDLESAIALIDELTDRELAPDEKDYLQVLSGLVERFEAEHFPVSPVSDADMLRHLMEAKGVQQAEIARATKIAESTISEVLSGKRSLNRVHIGKLATYFHVRPDVFYRPPAERSSAVG